MRLPITSVGQRIKAYRTSRQVSLRQLAKIAGIAPSTLSRIERGERMPKYAHLEALATALGVSVRQLIPPKSQAA